MWLPALADTEALNEVGSIVAVALSIEYPIETAGTEPHVVVLATSLKGDVTVAPFPGLATEILEVPATMVMLKSSWSFTCFPQHFTWRTCGPGLATTLAVKDVGSMIAELWSIE